MGGRRREPSDYCILPARLDPKEFVAPGDARISPLQHTSMTSCLYDITLKMGGVLRSLRLLWKIKLILKEEQELAIEGCFFLYGCQWDSGRVSAARCSRFCSTGGTLGWIHK